MAKPTDKLEWIPDDTTNITEPSGAKKTNGFIAEKPPFQFHNWIFNICSQWINYLDELVPSLAYNIVISSDPGADYATLAAYIADAPAAGDRVYMSVDEVFAATLVIPDNILLNLQRDKTISTTTDVDPLMQVGDNTHLEGDFHIEGYADSVLGSIVQMVGDNSLIDNIIMTHTGSSGFTRGLQFTSGVVLNRAHGTVDDASVISAVSNDAGNNSNYYLMSNQSQWIQSTVI